MHYLTPVTVTRHYQKNCCFSHVFDLIKNNGGQKISVGGQTECSYHDKGL